ncbi:MAG: restriction endonuclease subunit S [Campylobacterota bacterium]|nr:restriction endonuclease subunit S [Campylobacterota bacterium]
MFENTNIFLISEVFNYERGQRLIKRDQINGDIPYISSTMKNNGVDNLISLKSKNSKTNKHPKLYKNSLTIANSGSIGSVFYHPYSFIASDHVTVLSLKDRKLDFKLAFFFTVILNQKSSQYSYNREISNERMEVEKITLPVDSNEDIDWNFIYDFIENKLQFKKLKNELSKYNYISEPLAN